VHSPSLPALRRLACLAALTFSLASAAAVLAAAPLVAFKPVAVRTYPRPVESMLEAQIVLARHAISCGPIDGLSGAQTAAALIAFQQNQQLPATGRLDEATRNALVLTTPPLKQLVVTADDLARLQPLSPTWLGKSRQTSLAYENALELVSERTHSGPAFIRRLNPAVDWSAITPGTILSVPDVELDAPLAKPALLHVRLADHALEARDDTDALIAHFPVSIAKKVEKRPVGELHVAQHVRRRFPAVKVLYQTGFSDRLFENRSELEEGAAFLEKPFTARGLREAARLVLFGSINP